MALIPCLASVWVVRRWKLDWAIFGFGGLTFIASQVLHIPFNQFLLNPLLGRLGGERWGWVASALALGLSAGLFEEMARYFMLKRLTSRVRDWHQGILFGLGHGGVEAIILGGFALYAFFQATALKGVALEGVVPPEQLETVRLQLESYWGMAWYEPLWATLERISALAFHTLAALLVLVAVRNHQMVWLGAAILGHTIFNAVALISVKALGVAVTEILLAGIGVLCLWMIRCIRPRLGGDLEGRSEESAGDILPKRSRIASEIEAERLDDSKYT
jgi:uncharacterized membrane protein YhfC